MARDVPYATEHGVIVTAPPYTIAEFLRERVQRTRLVRSSTRALRLSRLFPVRSLTAHAAAAGAPHQAPVTGWWAFVHDADKILGIAEVALTAHAIVFTGINTGSLAQRAADVVKRAEGLATAADAPVWFLHSAPLFFTAVIVDLPSGATTLPVIGSPESDVRRYMQDVATRRLAQHARKPRRRRKSKGPQTTPRSRPT